MVATINDAVAANGDTEPQLLAILTIPAGATRYFKLVADVTGTNGTTNWSGSISTKVSGDSAYPALATTVRLAGAAVIDLDGNDDFIWSPNSTSTTPTVREQRLDERIRCRRSLVRRHGLDDPLPVIRTLETQPTVDSEPRFSGRCGLPVRLTHADRRQHEQQTRPFERKGGFCVGAFRIYNMASMEPFWKKQWRYRRRGRTRPRRHRRGTSVHGGHTDREPRAPSLDEELSISADLPEDVRALLVASVEN